MAARDFSRRPVLLLGSSGLLGRALCRELERRGESFVGAPRSRVELTRPSTLGAVVGSLKPRAVINTAAFTDVTRAERPEHREELFRVNRDGAEAVALACAEHDAALVHLSTDYVFDGAKREPYREDDATGPVQLYGRSKLEGEGRVLSACPAALIVRTSTLFGPGRPGRPHYVDAILDQARRAPVLEVVEAPVSSPTYAPDLAGAILTLLEHGAVGVIHVANAGWCSRLELARAAVELAGLAAGVELRVGPEPEGGPRRPAYSVLDTSRYASLTGSPLRTWREALAAYLRR